MLRTAMPDASARSIAVGLPGGQAYCFDAAESRFRYAWEADDDFLDVRALWTGRGGRPVSPVGERYYTAPEGFPIRLGEPEREPDVVRFSGYRLIEGIPEFRYEIDGVAVREKIESSPDGAGLVRSFELDDWSEDVWFFAGAVDNSGVVVTSPDGDLSEGIMRVQGGETIRFQVNITRAASE